MNYVPYSFDLRVSLVLASDSTCGAIEPYFQPKMKESKDSLLGDSTQRCHSVTNSEVNQCNKRFWVEMDSKVSKKFWEIISSLGIFREGNKEYYVEEIRKMKYRDKYGKVLRESAKYGVKMNLSSINIRGEEI